MILLDTHAWFFWTNDSLDMLSKNALQKIEKSQTLAISIISCWEIAMLVAKERIKLSIDIQLWIDQALKYPGINLLAIDPEIAVMSTRLPGQFHGDPADRILMATCLKYQIPIISKDQKIQNWGNVQAIW
jgi:PIN domain nuclease of toxin-antitoxin system